MNPPPYNTHVQTNAVHAVHNLGEPYPPPQLPPPPPVTTTVAMSQDYSFPPPPPPDQLAQLTQERMPSSIYSSGGIPYSNTTVGTTAGFQQTSFPPLYQNPHGMMPNQTTWNTGIRTDIGFQMGNVQHLPAMNYPGGIPPYPVTHHQQPMVIHGGPPPPYPGNVPTYASVTSVYPAATQGTPYSYSPSAPIATPPYSAAPHLHNPSQSYPGTAAPLPYPPR